MKKLVSLLLCIVMVFCVTVPTFAADKPIKVKLCNYMDNSGKWVSSKYIKFDVDPIIIDGRTMVPIRAVAEELGYEVTWHPSNLSTVGAVNIRYYIPKNKNYTEKNQNARLVNLLYNIEAENGLAPKPFESMHFDAYEEYLSVGALLSTEINKPSDSYVELHMSVPLENGELFNPRLKLWTRKGMCGSYYDLDVPPIIKDNRTLLPLRAVGEMLGLDVEWINSTRTVRISA